MSFKLMVQIYDLSDIAPVRKSVLAYLAFSALENGETIVGPRHVAKATGYSKERVQQTLHQLEREGYIARREDCIKIHLNEHGLIEKKTV